MIVSNWDSPCKVEPSLFSFSCLLQFQLKWVASVQIERLLSVSDALSILSGGEVISLFLLLVRILDTRSVIDLAPSLHICEPGIAPSAVQYQHIYHWVYVCEPEPHQVL